MNAFLKFNLIIHVIAGVIGIICSYAVLMALVKKRPNFLFLKSVSLASLLGYAVSGVAGKYYEETFYETAVRPAIKAGEYAWAHSLFEAKEAAFFLVFIFAFLTALAIWFRGKRLEEDEKRKKIVALLSLVAVILGTFVALAGMFVSGAANG